jgi:hypothetical protein
MPLTASRGQVFGMGRDQARDERLPLLLGDRRRHPLLQARNRKDQPVGRRACHRHPDAVAGPPAETRWHHPDDLVLHIVQTQALAEHVGRAAERLLPAPERQHDDGSCLAGREDVGRLETASERRRHPEELECIGRHLHSGHRLRRERPGEQP